VVEDVVKGSGQDEDTAALAGEAATHGTRPVIFNQFTVPMMANLVNGELGEAGGPGRRLGVPEHVGRIKCVGRISAGHPRNPPFQCLLDFGPASRPIAASNVTGHSTKAGAPLPRAYEKI
jgi:hypothetical protein